MGIPPNLPLNNRNPATKQTTAMSTLVRVIVKVGEISKLSRTNPPVDDAQFEFDEASQSFGELRAMVEERVARCLEQYEHDTMRPDSSIYLKPAFHANQKDFVALSVANYLDKLAHARSNYQKRKKVVGPFVAELFVFAAKKSSTGIRRATGPRVLQAAAFIDQYLLSRPDIQAGEIARTHWAVTHARHPDDTAIAVPDTATFRQTQYLDEMRASHDRALGPAASDYQTVTVRLNGLSYLQLSVNIRELRAALGLPSYNIMAEGVFNAFVPPAMPEEDVEDIDHMSD